MKKVKMWGGKYNYYKESAEVERLGVYNSSEYYEEKVNKVKDR